jgi:hypothetical protein
VDPVKTPVLVVLVVPLTNVHADVGCARHVGVDCQNLEAQLPGHCGHRSGARKEVEHARSSRHGIFCYCEKQTERINAPSSSTVRTN